MTHLEEDIKAVDRYHLFHFDRGWFLDQMGQYFDLEDEFAFDQIMHFFLFSKKAP